MNTENIEKELIKYVTESIPSAIKRSWPFFFILCSFLVIKLKPVIDNIPTRYQVKAILKTGKIEKRSYKSKILDDLNKVVENDPMESAVGLSTSDLEILLKGKYINHRSKLKKITDAGPFITNIEVPRLSKLILITAESYDVQKGKDVVEVVIKDLKDRFNKEKLTLEQEVKKRLSIVKKDHEKIKRELRKINKIAKEVGYSPVLTQQKNDLFSKETKLRYMIIDIEGQMNSDKLSQFKVLSITSSKYPVTTRKAYYYIPIIIVSGLAQIFLTLLVALFRHKSLPPILPNQLLIKGEK